MRLRSGLALALTALGSGLVVAGCLLPYETICDVPTAVGLCANGTVRPSLLNNSVTGSGWQAVLPLLALVVSVVSAGAVVTTKKPVEGALAAGILVAVGALTTVYFLAYLAPWDWFVGPAGVFGSAGGFLICIAGVSAAAGLVRPEPPARG